MARAKITDGKQTAIRVRTHQRGWLNWVRDRYGVSLAEYVSDLIDADRAQAMKDNGEDAERYRMYLQATGMSEELDYIDGKQE